MHTFCANANTQTDGTPQRPIKTHISGRVSMSASGRISQCAIKPTARARAACIHRCACPSERSVQPCIGHRTYLIGRKLEIPKISAYCTRAYDASSHSDVNLEIPSLCVCSCGRRTTIMCTRHTSRVRVCIYGDTQAAVDFGCVHCTLLIQQCGRMQFSEQVDRTTKTHSDIRNFQLFAGIKAVVVFMFRAQPSAT